MNKNNLKDHLYECLRVEVIRSGKPFSWPKAIHRAIKYPNRRFLFWWRIASYLHSTDNSFKRSLSVYINRKLTFKYSSEIQLGAKIGKGLSIPHHTGVNITCLSIIGEYFTIRQNTTIGIKFDNVEKKFISIGNNVDMGANCCIIGSTLKIGNNVTIGAMSFVNKDIPDNCIVYTIKSNELFMKAAQ